MFKRLKALATFIPVAILLVLAPITVGAQEAKPARVGFLRMTEPPALNLAAFHKGMRDLFKQNRSAALAAWRQIAA